MVKDSFKVSAGKGGIILLACSTALVYLYVNSRLKKSI